MTQTENKQTHSEKIMGLIDFVLLQADIKPAALDALAVSCGPGSFTGIRIGVNIVKAMAQALNIPCIGINTLDALCYAANGANLCCAVMDARRQEVYSVAKKGDMPVIEYGVRPIDELLTQIQALNHDALFVGDGVRVYGEMIAHTLKERAHFIPEPFGIQSAAAVAMLADKTEKSQWQDAYTLKPVYLRLSQAEREANMRQNGAK
jgi:tRNA threonylcarbamoyladenosine biosynthesis protein TsaB